MPDGVQGPYRHLHMVTWQEFVGIYADTRGGDATEAAPVWNRNKEQLQEASAGEVRAALE